jgi:hypothetical protein
MATGKVTKTEQLPAGDRTAALLHFRSADSIARHRLRH